MMEKLGVEKAQLIEELQAEYGRKKSLEHELQKTAGAEPRRAQTTKELASIKHRLDELQKR